MKIEGRMRNSTNLWRTHTHVDNNKITTHASHVGDVSAPAGVDYGVGVGFRPTPLHSKAFGRVTSRRQTALIFKGLDFLNSLWIRRAATGMSPASVVYVDICFIPSSCY